MMEDYTYVYRTLAFLLNGSESERQAVIENVRPEYFPEPCFADIFNSAAALVQSGEAFDATTVIMDLKSDSDSLKLKRRMDNFRLFFEKRHLVRPADTDKEIVRQMNVLFAEIINNMAYSIPPENLASYLRIEYSKREKIKVLEEAIHRLTECPIASFADEVAEKLKKYEELSMDRTWENYVVNPFTIDDEPEEVALIFRNGKPIFWRDNIYLVSGYAGVMKSYFSLVIAAAAVNGGINADKTLSFGSVEGKHKVLYVDTELAHNTVRKRMKTMRTMAEGRLDPEFFKYLELNRAPGDIQTKISLFETACRKICPDIIVIDSGRDFCRDFNDNREADALIWQFKQIAVRYHAVLICTCHKALGNGNAKGHFGMRFNEEAGLEISLSKNKSEQCIDVEFLKQREDSYEPFKFVFNQNTGLLEEHDPSVDHSARNRQYKAAEDALHRALRAGEVIQYRQLVSRLLSPEVGNVGSESTAKTYIRISTGTALVQTQDGKYRLSDPELQIPYERDLPES